MNWHAIYCTPNGEPTAYVGLGAKGFETFYPVQTLRTVYRGKHKSGTGTRAVSLFPGYIFARFDPGRDAGRVLETSGVGAILRGTSGKMSVIPDGIIKEIKRLMDIGYFDRSNAEWLKQGEVVRIVSGPFAGLIGRVRNARDSKRIEILIDYVHKAVMPLDKLEVA